MKLITTVRMVGTYSTEASEAALKQLKKEGYTLDDLKEEICAEVKDYLETRYGINNTLKTTEITVAVWSEGGNEIEDILTGTDDIS